MVSKDQLFIERRPQGDYAVRRGGSERASAVLPTQQEAIERARELNPGHEPLVRSDCATIWALTSNYAMFSPSHRVA
jgi:hypothetical protein